MNRAEAAEKSDKAEALNEGDVATQAIAGEVAELAGELLAQEAGEDTVGTSDVVDQGMGRGGYERWLKLAVKYAIGLVVVWAVGRQLMLTWGKWQAQRDLFEVKVPQLVVAGLLYIVGLYFFGLYFRVVVRLVAPGVSLATCMKAYVLSHPAKYVPGKAMVLVLRAGMLSRAGARPAAATFAAIYETLSMMALGGLLGGVLLMIPPGHLLGAVLSIGLGAAFLVTVLPMMFGKAVRILKKGVPRIEPADCPKPGRAEVAEMVLFGSLGWLAWGMSQVMVVSGLSSGLVWPVWEWPRIVGSVMLATVGGFALPLLPGGLGLREWIILEVSVGVLGNDLASVSALALRFVWVVAELVAAVVVSMIPEPIGDKNAEQESTSV